VVPTVLPGDYTCGAEHRVDRRHHQVDVDPEHHALTWSRARRHAQGQNRRGRAPQSARPSLSPWRTLVPHQVLSPPSASSLEPALPEPQCESRVGRRTAPDSGRDASPVLWRREHARLVDLVTVKTRVESTSIREPGGASGARPGRRGDLRDTSGSPGGPYMDARRFAGRDLAATTQTLRVQAEGLIGEEPRARLTAVVRKRAEGPETSSLSSSGQKHTEALTRSSGHTRRRVP